MNEREEPPTQGGEPGDEPDPRAGSLIPFHYIKSNHFRVLLADGVHGGISPRGWIQMNFFSERQPLPRVVYHALREGGGLGEEVRELREAREGVIREIEAEVVISVDTARSMIKWLQDKVDAAADLGAPEDDHEED